MKEFRDMSHDDYLEAVRSSMQHIVDRNPEMGELEVRSYILERLESMGIQHIMDTLNYSEDSKERLV